MIMPTAEFVVECRCAKEASVLFKSLSAEMQQGIPQTAISFNKQGCSLQLCICTKDASSLRAACNSYLRWLHTALQVYEVSLDK